MKKLAILLGTLAIAASAFAGGKEVVPDPASPTVIKEVEKVVYRDRANVGDLEIFYKWWGQSNTHTDNSIDGLKFKARQGNGNRGRLRIIGNLKLTERDSLYYRITDNDAIGSIGKESLSASGIGTITEGYRRSGESTEVRVRFSHKHDLLNGTSRLHYQNISGDYATFSGADHNLEYQFRIPLAEYFFDNDFIKTTTFTVAPKVGYSWDHSSGSVKKTHAAEATYYAGLDLYTFHTLPWNFSFEFNLYTGYYRANYRRYDDKKNNFGVYAEAYLRNKTPLVEFENSTLYFAFEGGFDPYKWSQRKFYGHNILTNVGVEENSKSSYSLYAFPALQLEYKATENITITTIVGAELRNASLYENSGEAQGWVWQPVVQTGFKVKF